MADKFHNACKQPVTSVTLRSWNDIHSYLKPGWIYRGQKSKDWPLMTSLERCCDREQIKPKAWGQGQITDCSHLLVFAAWDTYTAERINHMFDLTNAQRGGTNEGWGNLGLRANYRAFYQG